jgi:hypothetical protein
MGTWFVASLIVAAFGVPLWVLTSRQRARMRARGDVIPPWAWLVLCLAAIGLMLADLVFLLLYDGGSTSLGRACLMGAVAVLLWKLFRRQRERGG